MINNFKMFERFKKAVEGFNEEQYITAEVDDVFYLDPEFIYNIHLMVTEDRDLATGKKVERSINWKEANEELWKYALEKFEVRLDRRVSFEKMLKNLMDAVDKLNKLDYGADTEDALSDVEKEFSSNDLLYAFEIIHKEDNLVSSKRPNKQSVDALNEATINIDNFDTSKGFGRIRSLSLDEVKEIIDIDFILGC